MNTYIQLPVINEINRANPLKLLTSSDLDISSENFRNILHFGAQRLDAA